MNKDETLGGRDIRNHPCARRARISSTSEEANFSTFKIQESGKDCLGTTVTRWHKALIAFSACALGICVVVGVYLLIHSSIGRAIRGIAAVRVVNDGMHPLEGVRLVLRDSGRRRSMWSFPVVPPGESERAEVEAVDLYVEELSFSVNGLRKVFREVEILAKGEILVISVQDGGEIAIRHEV